MSNSCALNATGAAADPLAREARTIPPIFRKGALVLAGGAMAVTGAVGVAAAAHVAAPRPATHAQVLAGCTQGTPGCVYFHAGKFFRLVRRAR